MKPLIEIDYRQQAAHSGIENELRSAGFETQINNLDAADYSFRLGKKSIGVEEKTTDSQYGLLADIRTGRLFDQAKTAIQHYDICVLLLCGPMLQTFDDKLIFSREKTTNWQYSGVDAALMRLQTYGVMVAHSPQRSLVAKRLRQLYNFFQDNGTDVNRPPKPEMFTLDPLYSSAVQMLSCVPGVGVNTAADIVNFYHSPAGAIQAMLTNGCREVLGEKTAARAREFICKDFSRSEAVFSGGV